MISELKGGRLSTELLVYQTTLMMNGRIASPNWNVDKPSINLVHLNLDFATKSTTLPNL
jgi:hypothetical protein